MADPLPIPPITLRYKGLFDFDGLWAAVSDWAKNYGYLWHEMDYKHKVPSPRGAEQEMRWQMSKQVTEYVKYEINFVIHIWDLLEVEVDVDGRKKALANGRLYIVINGRVIPDWQKMYKGGKFAQTLGKLYSRIVQREMETGYWDPLYYRVWNLHAIIKKYFDMQTKKYAYKGYLGEK